MTTYLYDTFDGSGAVDGRTPNEGSGSWSAPSTTFSVSGGLMAQTAVNANAANFSIGSPTSPLYVEAEVNMPTRSPSNINECAVFEINPESGGAFQYLFRLAAFDGVVKWMTFFAEYTSGEYGDYIGDWVATAIPAGSTVTAKIEATATDAKFFIDGVELYSWAPPSGVTFFGTAVKLSIRPVAANVVAAAWGVDSIRIANSPASVPAPPPFWMDHISTIETIKTETP